MLNLLRENIRVLCPYSTARDDYQGSKIDIMLDANENPNNHTVSTFNALLNRYPDPRQKAVKQAISNLKHIPVEQIFIGNGSDEAIDLMYRLFCNPCIDNAVSIAPTYGMYSVAAAINNVELREVGLNADYSLPVDALLSATDEHTKLMWICSPNNPTGNAFDTKNIEHILTSFPGIVIIDEAYQDFSAQPSWLTRLDTFPRLVVLQTLSKAWGLAGLRCGLAFASTQICAFMDRVKYPYNINCLTQEIILQTLRDKLPSHDAEVQTIIAERQHMASELSDCPSVKQVFPSDANFLLIQVDNAKQRYQQLLQAGIIVRDRSNLSACPNCLRITIGTPNENNQVIACLKK